MGFERDNGAGIKTLHYRSLRAYYDGVKSRMIKLNMLPTFYSNITLRMASLNLRLEPCCIIETEREREQQISGPALVFMGRVGSHHLSVKVIF